ncbi:Hypothetical protein PHPALM_17865 [Phytophthora palmivora]|uniref:Uncharacterized protein n=1 Tax=Phytophthora palmivora TaxID=4796 RepID=A0A2P4XL53_9STRA|nr:Hypothetical protein PHPALM_17865 [Phytophthora palmivora]
MDLSMILSPAVDEEKAAAPTPREINRSWSSDELQCAVAILQDFQQPSSVATGPHADGTREMSDANQARHYSGQAQESVGMKPSNLRLDDEVQAATGHDDGKENKKEIAHQQNVPTGVWSDDTISKLDLLVQADAVIKRRRPKASPPLTEETSQFLRSGVWSRAEEEYAAALVSYFLHGLLDLPEGTTLRKFLAEQLCCNRRRVSMKLATESLAGQKIPRKVGASVFVAAKPPPSDEDRQEVKHVLETLRDASFNIGLERGYHDADQRHLHRAFDLDESDDDDGDHTFRIHHSQAKRSARNGLKPKRGKPTIIRTGFESPEEEEFVTAMFEFFMAGVLDLSEGTKLVNYLCQQLSCTPKQLSMKLAPRHMGELKFPDNVGSITYRRDSSSATLNDDAFSEELFEVESRLTELRLAFEEAHKNVLPPVVTPMKRERKFSSSSSSSAGTASVISTPNASPVRTFRRSGPWSHEEEVYAAALIDCFFKGVLDIAEGTTLRAFLSSRLCCNPMRISKKLASECIAEIRIPKKLGSSTYVLRAGVTPEEQAETEEALRSLQNTYIQSCTVKGNTLLSKRSRSYRSEGFRSRATFAPLDVDSDDTESDSDGHSVASSRSREKLLKTEKTHSPAQEARVQHFQGNHATKVMVPATLKEQLA